MSIHIFGIRHHGPGSARSLRQALELLKPEIILVEGPPDADGMLPLSIHPEMQPPVALLAYVPEQPQRCVYYPFAVFSPEWQAITYGLNNQIPVRFMDLPLAHRLAMVDKDIEKNDIEKNDINSEDLSLETDDKKEDKNNPPFLSILRADPLRLLAEAAGYSDGERWWENLVEQRRDSGDLFAAILEGMTALREETDREDKNNPKTTLHPLAEQEAILLNNQREAYMRKIIRDAQKEGFEKIAVVCGAWHSPALAKMPSVKEDTILLKGLPKIKIETTWVPWTYGRLAYNSGYGAGVESPGWYHHLFTVDNDVAIRWMTNVARLLREEGLDVSTAHLIETVRLAESLAALRDRPLPGLTELNEATQSVICFGNDIQMRLIHDKLIVSDRLGDVPDETPMVPLQQDLRRIKKRLRMPDRTEIKKPLEINLREPSHLEKSQLLYRLQLLGIPWGKKQYARTTGTFKEVWQLDWQPEFEVILIEKGIWGNSIYDAASNYIKDIGNQAKELPTLTNLVEQLLLAELPEASNFIMHRLEAIAAVANDITHLMTALPPLANVLRYGNVRKNDTDTINHIVDGLITRICINLPGACSSLDDDAANTMYGLINQVNNAISLLQKENYQIAWQKVLTEISDRSNYHGLIIGRCCRILLDTGVFIIDEAARRMGLALSTANEPSQAAAWVEGFIKGSALLLLHDDKLWQVLDNWVIGLNGDNFINLLPLLRRTFANFSAPERRQIGERVRRGENAQVITRNTGEDFDEESANLVLPIIAQILGIS